MSKITELRDGIAYVEAELRSIHETAGDEPLTAEQSAAWEAGVEYVEKTRDEVAKLDERAKFVADMKVDLTLERAAGRDVPNVNKGTETRVDVRTAQAGEVRDAAKAIIERADWVDADAKALVERAISGRTKNRDGDAIARRLVATEQPEYREGWLKAITGNADLLEEGERRALAEFRAMSNTVDTSGGYGVPVLIDPTIMITNGTGLTDILSYARIESITTEAWKGVSAGNTEWSFDAEAAQVSDDGSTFAQPTVKAHMARGFIPHSIEIGMDYPGFASEVGRLLFDGYTDLLAEKLAVGAGDGSNEPYGLFTALDAQTTTEVVVTTDGQFTAVDIDKIYKSVPEKFRARGNWVMNVDVENEIRSFGSGTATSRFTVDQTAAGISLLNGKAVILTDYAPEFTGATGAANILVFGDLKCFLVAQRVGMSVEYIPHLFGTTNNRPTGERGIFAYARVGSDVVVKNGLRLLQNT